jgi:quercetin dioxygenase-like cupin family protein
VIESNRNGSRPSATGPAQNFTGSVIVDPLFELAEHTHATGGLVTFEPGARTTWHTHAAGQTLIVTSGTGWVQQEMHSGRVFDLLLPLEQAAEGYRAMDERRAIKTLFRRAAE